MISSTCSWYDSRNPPLYFLPVKIFYCLGETKSFGQFFDGSLAGLTMLNGTTETERAIKCLNSCGEKLQFHAMDQLTVGMVSIV